MRLLFGVVLLLGGFFLGTAWKGYNDKADNNQDTAVQVGNKSATAGRDGALPPLSDELNPQELATIQLFEQAAPSVCFITTSTVQMDWFTRDVTEIPRGTGSGFVWDKDGHIVTNFHVIQGAQRATVTLADRSSWPAKLVGYAADKDLAVLKIEAPREALIPIPVGSSDNLRVGQSVYAIGNPFGLDQSLTTGVVSALGREIESVSGLPIRDVIQSDAAINPGNSGGPLLNSSGKLIGVNTAIYSPSGASAGIGFSIPVHVVNWVIPELIKYGELKRPTLGVELARPEIVARLGLQGALVIDVVKGSGAEKAGVRPTLRDQYGSIQLGDIIIGLDDQVINSNNDLILALEAYKPGQKVFLKVLRDEKERQLELTLDTSQ